MADYADVTRDWDPVAEALARAERERFLPVPVARPTETAVVHQPVPLAPPERPYDPWPARLGFGSVFVLASGTAVYIACAGLHDAGPFLPWLAGALAAAALLAGVLKGRSGSVSIKHFHQGDNAYFQAGDRR